MKVLVIPDVHLKPWIFERASEILHLHPEIGLAVCLMDIADDFGQQKNLGLYENTYDAAIRFHLEFPETLWCWGNHDISYLIGAYESGYSEYAQLIVAVKIRELVGVVRNNIQYVHKIDNVIFCHGGLSETCVKRCPGGTSHYHDIDWIVNKINSCISFDDAWKDYSPIWYRPQYSLTGYSQYKPRKLLQVVGHTPIKAINQQHNVLSCDSFSTYPDGAPYGTQEFTVVDTVTWQFSTIK